MADIHQMTPAPSDERLREMKMIEIKDDTLWCVNITGPDDVVAVESRRQAILAAMWFNQWWITHTENEGGLHPNDPTMWAVPIRWPWSAESHAENIARRGEPEYGAMFAAVAS